ncbi:hypothetical protein WL05_05300 [Burkholderia ubonensis]|nr:hypothetical protein WJ51_23985 [Burkholderia ubonensis]KVM11756.1 hypothetical protein WJ52_01040 [Burkholderia ubonensis]KVM44416.1 hypothetical protein WJ56_27730 [Burkholderia ubonensis]KVN70819.1 hypothetical protein WJ67_25570 [Burkholderia ubonensis]KVP68725.1 hypothetical protein WJ92_32635 [Burkholderia ubonensis]
MKLSRKNQLKMLCLHLICLICTDRGFKSQKMFVFNLVCFCQYLAPTILASALDTENRQAIRIEFWIVIGL